MTAPILATPELYRRRNLRSRAFTLIELIVTLVIIATLIAVAAVSYNSVIGNTKDTATGVQLTQLYKTAAGVAALNREPLTFAHFQNAAGEVTLAAGAVEAPALAAGHFEVLPATTPVTHVGQVQVAITTTDTGAQVTGLAALSRDGHCVLVRGENMGTRIAGRDGNCSEDAADQAQTLTAGADALPAPEPTQTTPALPTSGFLYGVGYNAHGQLGDGTTVDRASYAQVANAGVLAGKTIAAAAEGDQHTCALATDNTLACWGLNEYGQVGDSSQTDRTLPTAVRLGVLAGKTITSVVAGISHTCALATDSTIACWGYNSSGQLGDNSTTTRPTPVLIAPGALAGKTVVQLVAGNYHTCALATDNTIACWGYNPYGQIGDNSTTNRLVPTAAKPGALAGKTVTSLTAGAHHTCALTNNGTVACWGWNALGQLGDSTTVNRPTPSAVVPGALAGKTVMSLAAGKAHTCALATDHTLTCWGAGTGGQLGTDGTVNQPVPTLADSLPAALAGKTPYTLLSGSANATFVLAG